MSKDSDINVGSIEEDINELKTLLFQDRLTNYGKRKMINYYENEITRQKQINEEHKRLNGELREKVKELEEKNKHLSNTSDYETISLECTNLEEQLEIANNRIQELEEENKRKDKFIKMAKEVIENSILKQKIKDLLTEIQEEYNKLDKEIDKQIKDKNKDYYKCKENIAIMQTLAYCRDKFEGLLEEK